MTARAGHARRRYFQNVRFLFSDEPVGRSWVGRYPKSFMHYCGCRFKASSFTSVPPSGSQSTFFVLADL